MSLSDRIFFTFERKSGPPKPTSGIRGPKPGGPCPRTGPARIQGPIQTWRSVNPHMDTLKRLKSGPKIYRAKNRTETDAGRGRIKSGRKPYYKRKRFISSKNSIEY